jgi:anti-anti-sigma factor
MEIVRTPRAGYLEMSFEGRLDGYWAQHLAESAGQTMREGTHALRLNLSKTSYISSAGIGALVRIYKEFAAVNGSFGVVEPSRLVQQILEMVGLGTLLLGTEPAPVAHAASAGAEVFDCVAGAQLTCAPFGNPERLAAASFGEGDCLDLDAGPDLMALGLGALGEGFANCRDRFGEFLAIAGAAAYQPTDGTNLPDYMVSSGTFVPHVTALYGLRCRGSFSTLLRFEESSALSSVLKRGIEAARAQTVGMLILAESAGLTGALLKRSPVSGGPVFSHPEIQSWVSFSTEPCYARHLVLLAGVVSENPSDRLRPFLRPVAKGAAIEGHFHAAAFGYRPLPKGRLDLDRAVKELFDSGGLQGVLHVLSDDRERGVGESKLLRGACWVSPIVEAV